jgi:hypothetical protein
VKDSNKLSVQCNDHIKFFEILLPRDPKEKQINLVVDPNSGKTSIISPVIKIYPPYLNSHIWYNRCVFHMSSLKLWAWISSTE